MLTPAKIASNKYLKKVIRVLGIPSKFRQQAWLLLSLNEKRFAKLETQTIDDMHFHKIQTVFGNAGMPKSISSPPTFGSSKISLSEHCLKDTPDTLQALYRILLLLQESLGTAKPELVQLPDVVAFLMHYQTEPEAFYTAYSMVDDIPKYFAKPSSDKFDYMIRYFLPKIWSRTSLFRLLFNQPQYTVHPYLILMQSSSDKHVV